MQIDEAADDRRIEWFREGGADGRRTIIHLGALRKQCGAWLNVAGFHSLDELFALQKQQDEARTELFARAHRACAEKARLRGLPGSPGGSVTLPHGWEDLAVFA